jgi:hypothetical protein
LIKFRPESSPGSLGSTDRRLPRQLQRLCGSPIKADLLKRLSFLFAFIAIFNDYGKLEPVLIITAFIRLRQIRR